MNFRKIVLALAILIITLLLACATREAPSKQEKVPAQIKGGAEQPAPSKEAWEVDWDKTLEAARKEGKVVIVTASKEPALKEAAPVVKKRFGLTLEATTRRGGQLMAVVLAQRKAGIYGIDVIITGFNTFFGQIEPEGIAVPLEPVIILPEVLDPKNWQGGQVNWGNKERRVINLDAYPISVVARNSEQVKPEEIKSYYDLLNPKFKGKIVMNDPTIPGSGLKGFSVLAFHILDLDYFRQLARLEPIITRDQRLQVDWLAKGKASLTLFAIPPVIKEFQDAGAPVEYVTPKEGTYLSRDGGGVVLLNRAPHPNAAKIFINWVLSKEGMTIMSRAYGAQSAREDVATEGIPSILIRQPGMKYFADSDTKEWINRDPEFKKAALETLGHLMR